ncbi:MAG: ATP-binding protein [Methanofollis sp.]|nr:ATP-binding protein [Methanofollis sp.]
MEIRRDNLDNAFLTFALEGSGIVIGPPGVGKTHQLKKTCKYFHENGIPFLYIPVDKLSGDSKKDLGDELGLKCPLIEYLQAQTKGENGKPRILIIDAFDAARSDRNRKYYLDLIYQVQNQLGESWNVIVSARTYDAQRSETLMDLFASHNEDIPDPAYQMSDIFCRHFVIPKLTEKGLQDTIEIYPAMQAVVDGASEEFKELLRIPFNLTLLEKLVKRDSDICQFTPIRTETELLDLFWKQRVLDGDSGEKKQIFLTKLTRRMVDNYVLSARKEDIEDIQEGDILRDLLDLEILVNASVTRQRVAYAHNILFDYAVSILLIDDEPRELVEFISEEPERTLFLRPSLYYYFVRLWLKHSDLFWKVFWYIQRRTDANIRLFARLLPTSVIVREARTIEQLSPLITSLNAPHNRGEEAILDTLQALCTFQSDSDALQNERDTLWIRFLRILVDHMDDIFAWESAFLISEICNRAENGDNKQVLQCCGESSRKFLEWIWDQRENIEKRERIDALGARWIVPLVTRTYSTDPNRSRELLESVLQVMHEEDFSLAYIYKLANHVNQIWPSDPNFAARIYTAIWAHTESSNEQTRLGCSALLTLYSTRRQDFSMCQYSLTKHAPNFLRDKPVVGTGTLIKCLNQFIIDKYILCYSSKNIRIEDLREEFQFHGKPAFYISDRSYIYDDGNAVEEVKLADELYNFIDELTLSESGRAKIPVILDLFQEHAQAAYLWRRLFKLATQHAEVFAQPLFDLCRAPPVMVHTETHEVLRDFLAVATPEYTDDQVHCIEEAILKIPKEETDPKNKKYLIHRRDRLLSRLPLDRLMTAEAREIKKGMMADYLAKLDKPLISISRSTTEATENDWLELQGAHPDRSENQNLLKYSTPLDKFTVQWRNKEPTPASIREIIPIVQGLLDELKLATTAEPAVNRTAWTNLASCVCAMSKGVKDSRSQEYQFCRSVLLKCAVHELPIPDPTSDSGFNFPFWSPAPRNEAASGLIMLAMHEPDSEILKAIVDLSQDPVPSVRYLAMTRLFYLHQRSPKTFWNIIEERSKYEQNRVVLEALCRDLQSVIVKDRENAQKTLETLVNRTIRIDESKTPLKPLLSLLVGLDIIHQDAWAGEVTSKLLTEPTRYATSLQSATSSALSILRSPDIDSREGGKCTERAVQWIEKAINAVADGIKELNPNISHSKDENIKSSMKSFYETIDRTFMLLKFAIDERSNKQKRNLYSMVKPVMEKISSFALDKDIGVMFAPTAYWFMELLNSVLIYDPKGVIHMAADVAEASKPTGYNNDPLALNDVVKLVETILADHRYDVQEGEALQDLLRLLDIFAESGNPEALRLVWRLDEIYR